MDLEHGFRLGEWTVLPRQSSLEKDGESIHLQPRVMGVLVCLAQHAPETATRDEIFDEVWAGRVVQDQVLDHNISVLRSRLGAETGEPGFVKTIHGVGYQLLVEPSPLTAVAETATGLVPRVASMVLVVAAVVLAVVFRGQWDTGAASDAQLSVDDFDKVEPRSI